MGEGGGCLPSLLLLQNASYIEIPDSDNVPPLSPPVCTELSSSWVSLNWILYQTINTKLYSPPPPPPAVIPPPPSSTTSKFFTLFFSGVFRRQSLNINWLCNHQINVLVNKTLHNASPPRKEENVNEENHVFFIGMCDVCVFACRSVMFHSV